MQSAHPHQKFQGVLPPPGVIKATSRFYAGEIWKHSFISTVRPTVEKLLKPGEVEKRPLGILLQLELKHSSKTMASHDKHTISLLKFSSNTNPKWPVIVPFSMWTGPYKVMENILSNFLTHFSCLFSVQVTDHHCRMFILNDQWRWFV